MQYPKMFKIKLKIYNLTIFNKYLYMVNLIVLITTIQLKN